jgi:DNA uptake protein ComE-like DNA-binding protein
VPPRKRTTAGREQWVPAPVAKRSRRARTKSTARGSSGSDPDTDEWLVPGEAEAPKPRTRPRKRTRSPQARRSTRPKAEQTANDAELNDLRDRLAQAESRAKAAESRAEEAARSEREARDELAKLLEQPEKPKRQSPKAQKPKTPAGRRTASRTKSNGKRLDINRVRFEDLRAMGLSIAQSAQLIAMRETRKGFESLKELDELPDLSDEVVSTLKQRLQV